MQDFRKLMVWVKAHRIALATYKLTKNFPKEEKFGLIAQLCRSAISIPSNVAEGTGRRSSRDFARFLQIAFSSCSELEYQFLLAKDLEYLRTNDYFNLQQLIIEIKRMHSGLIDTVSGSRQN